MNKLTHFLRETFRPHTREELTLATTQSGSGTPWLYLRVVLAVIFVIAPWILYLVIAGYSREFEPIIVSSLVFVIGYVVLAYELAPGSEYKLWELLIWGTVGGTVSILLVVAIADIFDFLVTEDWHSALRAGIGEELYKLIVAVIILKITKKKKPVDGLLMGLFIGAGFAFFENVMYLYRSSTLSDFVANFIERNASTIFTHMFWTGLTAYAFNKLPHPLRNFRFYLILLLSMALHSLWDMPTFEWLPDFLKSGDFCNTNLWEWLLVGLDLVISTLAFISWFKARGRIQREAKATEPVSEPVSEPTADMVADVVADVVKNEDALEATEHNPLEARPSLFFVIMAFTFSAFLCIFAMLHSTDSTQSVTKNRTDLGPYAEYVLKSNNGLEIEVDFHRAFDEHPETVNHSEYYENGVLKNVEQWVAVPGGFLEYTYCRNEETGAMELNLRNLFYIMVTVDDEGNEGYEYASPYYALKPGLFSTILVGSSRTLVNINTLLDYTYGEDYVVFFNLRDFGENYEQADTWKYDEFLLIDGHVYGVESTTTRTIGALETLDWIVIGACSFSLLAELAILIIEMIKNKKRASE